MAFDPDSSIRRLLAASEPARKFIVDMQRQADLAAKVIDRDVWNSKVVEIAEKVTATHAWMHESVVRPTVEIAAGFRRMAEEHDQLQADERELMDAIAPLGWVMSPSLARVAPRELLRLLHADGVEAVEAALIAHFTPERCREVLTPCFEQPSYERWRPRFEEALDAHERGQFGLSIPVWLIALDGIAWEELEVRRIFSELRKTKPRQRIANEITPPWGASAHSEALLEVLRSLGEPTNDPTGGEGRRNIILHGRDPDYASEAASIQLIIVLESLREYLAVRSARIELDEREQQAADE